MTYEAKRKRYRKIRLAAAKVAYEQLQRRIERRREAEFKRDLEQLS